jgi:hypothetical protein
VPCAKANNPENKNKNRKDNESWCSLSCGFILGRLILFIKIDGIKLQITQLPFVFIVGFALHVFFADRI